MHQNILQNISQNGWYFAEYSDAFFFHASMCSPEATMTPLTDSPTAERSQKSAGVNMKKKKNNDPVSLTQRKARRCTRCDNGQNQDNEDPQCDIHLTTIQQLDLIDINWCRFKFFAIWELSIHVSYTRCGIQHCLETSAMGSTNYSKYGWVSETLSVNTSCWTTSLMHCPVYCNYALCVG